VVELTRRKVSYLFGFFGFFPAGLTVAEGTTGVTTIVAPESPDFLEFNFSSVASAAVGSPEVGEVPPLNHSDTGFAIISPWHRLKFINDT